MNRFVLLIFFIYLLSSKCFAQDSSCVKKIANCYGINSSIIDIWEKDSLGCLRLRGIYIKDLIDNTQMINIPKKVFLMIFGKPNKEDDNGDEIVYYYNVITYCENNRPSKKGDDSTLVFLFVKEMLVKIILQIE